MRLIRSSAKKLAFILVFSVFLSVFTGILAQSEPLEDGIYSALFTTDSSMFHVNEAFEDRGVLTVKDGEMYIHVSLVSKSILNLFPGFAKDAEKEGAEWLEPTLDEVTYSDGFKDKVYGFDIPVPVLDKEFDLALVGKKGKWYDHKVSVSDPLFVSPLPEASIADGVWLCDVTLTGGSGRAGVESPAALSVKDGEITATVIWSSKNYEYMLVDGVQYDPVNTEGNSTFEIPVIMDAEMPVSALTIAMSEPHLIDYTLFFDSSTLENQQ